MVMMTFQVHLKKVRMPNQPKLRGLHGLVVKSAVCASRSGGFSLGTSAFALLLLTIGSIQVQYSLKDHKIQIQPKLRFNLEKLRDPAVAHTFHATISGKIHTTHWSEGCGHGHEYHDYHLQ